MKYYILCSIDLKCVMLCIILYLWPSIAILYFTLVYSIIDILMIIIIIIIDTRISFIYLLFMGWGKFIKVHRKFQFSTKGSTVMWLEGHKKRLCYYQGVVLILFCTDVGPIENTSILDFSIF